MAWIKMEPAPPSPIYICKDQQITMGKTRSYYVNISDFIDAHPNVLTSSSLARGEFIVIIKEIKPCTSIATPESNWRAYWGGINLRIDYLSIDNKMLGMYDTYETVLDYKYNGQTTGPGMVNTNPVVVFDIIYFPPEVQIAE